MSPYVHHPTFKKLCGMCGKVKWVLVISGGYEFKACPVCDGPDQRVR